MARDVYQSQSDGIIEWSIYKSSRQYLVTIAGDGLYARGIYLIEVLVPLNFPNNPMNVRFLNKIYHPNVYTDGQVCSTVISSLWRDQVQESESYLSKIFNVIVQLFTYFDEESVLKTDAGYNYKNHYERFLNIAQKWVDLYAI